MAEADFLFVRFFLKCQKLLLLNSKVEMEKAAANFLPFLIQFFFYSYIAKLYKLNSWPICSPSKSQETFKTF